MMKANKALQVIALKHGVSVEEIRKEIQFAIDEGMKNSNPQIQAYWNSIPCRGNKPTPEEVITDLAKKVEKRL